MRRTLLVFGLGLGLPTVASCQSDANATAAQPVVARNVDDTVRGQADAWVGDYRFVGGQAEIDGRDAAIEKVVQELNALIRSVGRERLTKVNPIPETLTISRKGDELTVARDSFAHTANLNGTIVESNNPFGDPVQYRIELDADHLAEIIIGEGGGRTNTYRTAGEGRITMGVRMTSPRLPIDVVYSLTFAKK